MIRITYSNSIRRLLSSARSKLVSEFKNCPNTLINMALEASDYDLGKTRILIRWVPAGPFPSFFKSELFPVYAKFCIYVVAKKLIVKFSNRLFKTSRVSKMKKTFWITEKIETYEFACVHAFVEVTVLECAPHAFHWFASILLHASAPKLSKPFDCIDCMLLTCLDSSWLVWIRLDTYL